MSESESQRTKFTVIIPTRERCDTLESSLKTCVTQDYENLEIIVSDNFSQDNTKEIVKSFRDSRIRYINTGKRVSMSDNWEFALSHVDGGYIMFLGDDDGLLPGSLAELNKVIIETACEAISWKSASYTWPDFISKTGRNLLMIPLQTALVKRNSKEMLIDVINFKRPYGELPLLYRGFVSYDAIKRVLQKSGRFFHSMTPDVYSGIALACILETYYFSFKPYAIIGASHHSIGAASFVVGSDQPTAKEFLNENNMPFHSNLVNVPSMPIIVAESFLQAQDHISSAKRFKIDIKKVLKAAFKQSVHYTNNQYEMVIEAVKKIAHLNQIDDNFISQIILAHKNLPRLDEPVLGFNIVRGHLKLDCTEFGVRNVYEASLLCRHVLTFNKFRYYRMREIFKTNLRLIKRKLLSNRFN